MSQMGWLRKAYDPAHIRAIWSLSIITGIVGAVKLRNAYKAEYGPAPKVVVQEEIDITQMPELKELIDQFKDVGNEQGGH